MTRWERAEAGRRLRRLGWTYAEIMEVLPVAKSTLAGWCRDIRLTSEQIAAIQSRRPYQLGTPKNTNWKRRAEIETIRAAARAEVADLKLESLWVAGTTMYWAEGAKTTPRLGLANTDPRVLVLFIRWVRMYLVPDPEFVLALHLHAGNDEDAAKLYWASALGLTDPDFHKTFIKPPGTGHRKNRLPWGVCRVRVRRSADAYHRTMAWIDQLAREQIESVEYTGRRVAGAIGSATGS
jgi:hypothetical protein